PNSNWSTPSPPPGSSATPPPSPPGSTTWSPAPASTSSSWPPGCTATTTGSGPTGGWPRPGGPSRWPPTVRPQMSAGLADRAHVEVRDPQRRHGHPVGPLPELPAEGADGAAGLGGPGQQVHRALVEPEVVRRP